MKFSMAALARLGIAVVTALATALLQFVQGGEFAGFLGDIFGEPILAGTVAGLVAWLVGWLVKKIPKQDVA